jgi:flagellin FlaB
MFDTNGEMQDRGQVGIGTLIVFIALVLVAAIAAGVLINTAGFLQTQAEATGEESTSQVSDRINAVTTTGSVVDDTGNSGDVRIESVDIVVSLAPGADPVELDDATIEVLNGQSETLVKGTAGNGGEFGSTGIGGSDDTILSDQTDRIRVEFNLGNNIEYMTEGERLSLTITTSDGGQTRVNLQAPSSLTTQDDGSAVNL